MALAHNHDYEDQRLGRERERMLRQLRHAGIESAVIDAMASTPRETFVPPSLRHRAYDDCALPIGERQTISQPLIVGAMTSALRLSQDDSVLEVGTGSGYQAAILCRLARELVSVERIDALRVAAADTLHDLGCQNVRVVPAETHLGYAPGAPYDAIIVTAAAPHVPRVLVDQLADGGRLVLPVGDLRSQLMVRATRAHGTIELEQLGGCAFVPLIGEGAWSVSEASEKVR